MALRQLSRLVRVVGAWLRDTVSLSQLDWFTLDQETAFNHGSQHLSSNRFSNAFLVPDHAITISHDTPVLADHLSQTTFGHGAGSALVKGFDQLTANHILGDTGELGDAFSILRGVVLRPCQQPLQASKHSTLQQLSVVGHVLVHDAEVLTVSPTLWLQIRVGSHLVTKTNPSLVLLVQEGIKLNLHLILEGLTVIQQISVCRSYLRREVHLRGNALKEGSEVGRGTQHITNQCHRSFAANGPGTCFLRQFVGIAEPRFD